MPFLTAFYRRCQEHVFRLKLRLRVVPSASNDGYDTKKAKLNTNADGGLPLTFYFHLGSKDHSFISCRRVKVLRSPSKTLLTFCNAANQMRWRDASGGNLVRCDAERWTTELIISTCSGHVTVIFFFREIKDEAAMNAAVLQEEQSSACVDSTVFHVFVT